MRSRRAVGEGAIATEAERARIFEETRDQMIEFFGEHAIAPSGELIKYQETPLGQKYTLWRERARHAESAGDVRRDIYNHLYAFFSRYYQDGDFVPQRRYSHEAPLRRPLQRRGGPLPLGQPRPVLRKGSGALHGLPVPDEFGSPRCASSCAPRT